MTDEDGIHPPAQSIEPPEHYYGDWIRILFLASSLGSFVAIPIWGSLLPVSVFAQILGGMLLVLLAGLTSPHGRFTMFMNVLASGVGATFIEYVVISSKGNGDPTQLFLLREAEVLMLIVAFYFSVKTLRAMLLGRVGHSETVQEFAPLP